MFHKKAIFGVFVGLLLGIGVNPLYGDNVIFAADGYSGDTGHYHNQDVNTTSNVSFNQVNITTNSRLFWENIEKNLTIESQKNISMITNFIIDSVNIDTEGIIDMRYQPGCRVRLEDNQLVPSGIWTKLNLIVEDHDNNANYDNAINIRFDIPKTGIYSISYSAKVDGIIGNSLLITAIYVNGVIAGGYEISELLNMLSVNLVNSGADIMKLNKNDFIELWVYHNDGFNRFFPAVIYSNYLAIQKLA